MASPQEGDIPDFLTPRSKDSAYPAVPVRGTVDAFLCYAREDGAFVADLFRTLTENGRTCWMDQHSIPYSSDWWAEIERGIDAANNFVFVVSPDAVASVECGRELDHAVRRGKRIVPILYRATDAGSAPRAISSIQWLPFEAGSDFDASRNQLLATLDTDLDYTRAHTRLLVRATEWEAASEDRSLKLRGAELKRAENWLTAAAQHGEPRPVLLQARYVLASSRAAVQRLSMTLAVACLVVAALGGLWWRANVERRIAISRQFAAEALNLVEPELDLALLLAAEALAFSPTVEARDALLVALEHAGPIDVFLDGHRNSVNTVAFDVPGKQLVSAADDSLVIRWDVASRSRIGAPLRGHEDAFVTGALFSSPRNIVSASDFALRIWDTRTESPTSRVLPRAHAPLKSLAATRDGRLVVAGDLVGNLLLWNMVESIRVDSAAVEAGPVLSLAVTPDDRALASGHGDGSIHFWSLADDRLRPLSPSIKAHDERTFALAFSPSGDTLASGGFDGVVRLWDTSSRAAVSLAGPLKHGSRVLAVAFDPSGGRLLSGGWDGRLVVWDPRTHAPIDTLATGRRQPVTALAFAPDSVTLAVGHRDGTLSLWDLKRRSRIGRTLTERAGHLIDLAFGAGEQAIISGNIDGAIVAWNARSPGIVAGRPIDVPANYVQSFAASVRDGPLAMSIDDTLIVLLDAHTFSPLGAPIAFTDSGDVLDLALSPSGRTLAASTDSGYIVLWDVATHSRIGHAMNGRSGGVMSIAFSPDGQVLAAGDNDGGIQRWRTRDQSALGERLKSGGAWSVAYSQDGHFLFSGGQDGAIRMRDATSGALVAVLPREGMRAEALAVSSDGSTLAAGYDDGAIVLWDTRAKRAVGRPLRGHREALAALVFDASGNQLVSGDTGGRITIWELSSRTWRAHACNVANRSFTAEEMQRYLGDGSRAVGCLR